MVALIVILSQSPSLFAQDEVGPQAPGLQITIAAFSFILIMLILCMPSRKRQGEKKT
jgi:hypothetical protein